MGDSNISCTFQLHSMQIFFQNGDLKFPEVATTPPDLNFDGLPYPHLKEYNRHFSSK